MVTSEPYCDLWLYIFSKLQSPAAAAEASTANSLSAAAPATRNSSAALSATTLLTTSARTRETKVERSRTRRCDASEDMSPDLAL